MLATRCPHCQTTFRVAHDQLKLRGGLVRCGACKEIFNGIEHLLRSDELQPPLPSPVVSSALQSTVDASPASDVQPVVSSAADEPAVPANEPIAGIGSIAAEAHEEAAPAAADEFADFSEFLTPAANTAAEVEPEAEATPSEKEEISVPAISPEPETAIDPLQGITLMDIRSLEVEAEDQPEISMEEREDTLLEEMLQAQEKDPAPVTGPDPLAQAIDNLHRMPPRTRSLGELRPGFQPDPLEPETEEAEPDFVRQGRRKQQRARASRLVMGVGSVLLFCLLLFQGAYAFRNMLAVSFPEARPVLEKICSLANCRLELPTQIDSISIESSDFQSLPDRSNTLMLSMLLRNRSQTPQAWPSLELTLNDANDKPIVRRVFSPREYLPPGVDAARGFPRYSEQAVKVYFEVSQLKPDGYRLYVFYP